MVEAPLTLTELFAGEMPASYQELAAAFAAKTAEFQSEVTAYKHQEHAQFGTAISGLKEQARKLEQKIEATQQYQLLAERQVRIDEEIASERDLLKQNSGFSLKAVIDRGFRAQRNEAKQKSSDQLRRLQQESSDTRESIDELYRQTSGGIFRTNLESHLSDLNSEIRDLERRQAESGNLVAKKPELYAQFLHQIEQLLIVFQRQELARLADVLSRGQAIQKLTALTGKSAAELKPFIESTSCLAFAAESQFVGKKIQAAFNSAFSAPEKLMLPSTEKLHVGLTIMDYSLKADQDYQLVLMIHSALLEELAATGVIPQPALDDYAQTIITQSISHLQELGPRLENEIKKKDLSITSLMWEVMSDSSEKEELTRQLLELTIKTHHEVHNFVQYWSLLGSPGQKRLLQQADEYPVLLIEHLGFLSQGENLDTGQIIRELKAAFSGEDQSISNYLQVDAQGVLHFSEAFLIHLLEKKEDEFERYSSLKFLLQVADGHDERIKFSGRRELANILTVMLHKSPKNRSSLVKLWQEHPEAIHTKIVDEKPVIVLTRQALSQDSRPILQAVVFGQNKLSFANDAVNIESGSVIFEGLVPQERDVLSLLLTVSGGNCHCTEAQLSSLSEKLIPADDGYKVDISFCLQLRELIEESGSRDTQLLFHLLLSGQTLFSFSPESLAEVPADPARARNRSKYLFLGEFNLKADPFLSEQFAEKIEEYVTVDTSAGLPHFTIHQPLVEMAIQNPKLYPDEFWKTLLRLKKSQKLTTDSQSLSRYLEVQEKIESLGETLSASDQQVWQKLCKDALTEADFVFTLLTSTEDFFPAKLERLSGLKMSGVERTLLTKLLKSADLVERSTFPTALDVALEVLSPQAAGLLIFLSTRELKVVVPDSGPSRWFPDDYEDEGALLEKKIIATDSKLVVTVDAISIDFLEDILPELYQANSHFKELGIELVLDEKVPTLEIRVSKELQNLYNQTNDPKFFPESDVKKLIEEGTLQILLVDNQLQISCSQLDFLNLLSTSVVLAKVLALNAHLLTSTLKLEVEVPENYDATDEKQQEAWYNLRRLRRPLKEHAYEVEGKIAFSTDTIWDYWLNSRTYAGSSDTLADSAARIPMNSFLDQPFPFESAEVKQNLEVFSKLRSLALDLNDRSLITFILKMTSNRDLFETVMPFISAKQTETGYQVVIDAAVMVTLIPQLIQHGSDGFSEVFYNIAQLSRHPLQAQGIEFSVIGADSEMGMKLTRLTETLLSRTNSTYLSGIGPMIKAFSTHDHGLEAFINCFSFDAEVSVTSSIFSHLRNLLNERVLTTETVQHFLGQLTNTGMLDVMNMPDLSRTEIKFWQFFAKANLSAEVFLNKYLDESRSGTENWLADWDTEVNVAELGSTAEWNLTTDCILRLCRNSPHSLDRIFENSAYIFDVSAVVKDLVNRGTQSAGVLLAIDAQYGSKYPTLLMDTLFEKHLPPDEAHQYALNILALIGSDEVQRRYIIAKLINSVGGAYKSEGMSTLLSFIFSHEPTFVFNAEFENFISVMMGTSRHEPSFARCQLILDHFPIVLKTEIKSFEKLVRLHLMTRESIDFMQQALTGQTALNPSDFDEAFGRQITSKSYYSRNESMSELAVLAVDHMKGYLTTLSAESEIELTEANWMNVLLIFIALKVDDFDASFVPPEIKAKVELLFNQSAAKDYCLNQVRSKWLSYLKSDLKSFPLSTHVLLGFLDYVEEAGPLKHLDALAKLMHDVDGKVVWGGLRDKTSIPILEGLQTLERRFDEEGWSLEDRFSFYSLSHEVVETTPTLWSEFMGLFSELSAPQLKYFMKELYSLYHAEMVLNSTVDRYGTVKKDVRGLQQLRKDVRSLHQNCKKNESEDQRQLLFDQEKERIIFSIKDKFKTRFGILKIPEQFTDTDIQTLQNLTLYLANVNGRSPLREAEVSLYLALVLDHKWASFRAGEPIALDQYLDTPQQELLRPILEKRQLNLPVTAEGLGISPEKATQFNQILQSDVEVTTMGNLKTVDVKLGMTISNLKELADPHVYDDLVEKAFIVLLQKHGSSNINLVLSKMFRELTGKLSDDQQFTAEEAQLKSELVTTLDTLKLKVSVDTLKQIQKQLKNISGVINILEYVNDLNVEQEIEILMDLLNPSPEIIAIFTSLGEDFTPSSGALALSQDLNFLENLIVKNAEKLSEVDRNKLQTYLTAIRQQLAKLEDNLDKIKQKFDTLQRSQHTSSNERLKDRISEIAAVIKMESQEQFFTSRLTIDMNVVIQNIRACLGCRRPEANNDTNLTFGEANKFFITSSPGAKGSFADQLVYFMPTRPDLGTTQEVESELSFVIDQLYGAKSADVLLNHIAAVLKKYQLLKSAVPEAKMSIVVSSAAYSTVGLSDALLIKRLEELNVPNLKVESVSRTVTVPKSELGDHYIEFGGGARTTGDRSIRGLRLVTE